MDEVHKSTPPSLSFSCSRERTDRQGDRRRDEKSIAIVPEGTRDASSTRLDPRGHRGTLKKPLEKILSPVQEGDVSKTTVFRRRSNWRRLRVSREDPVYVRGTSPGSPCLYWGLRKTCRYTGCTIPVCRNSVSCHLPARRDTCEGERRSRREGFWETQSSHPRYTGRTVFRLIPMVPVKREDVRGGSVYM